MSGIEVAIAAGVALSAGAQIYSGIQSANTMERNAQLRDEQANELLRRAVRDQHQLKLHGMQFQAAQVSAMSASGRELSGNSPLALLEATAAGIEQEIFDMNRRVAWEADQIRRGAEIERDAASAQRLGALLGGAGTLVSGLGRIPSFREAVTRQDSQPLLTGGR